MSLTNNEVKFLVTLDIDEDKSKKKIDSFLSKAIKDQKIVFDVAVGKSESNINEFLKKHKEKKASILFDVAVGKSDSNISTYLRNRKQDTQSLIFYVNENATRAKINSALKTMKFNPALIELKVDTKQTVANLNKFIDNSKLHKKIIDLDIDESTAFTSINTKIFNKKLNNGKISLALESGAFDSITSNIKEKLFTGARITGQLDIESTTAKITQQIAKMKLPKITVDVEAVVTEGKPKVTTPSSTSKPVSNPDASSDSNVINGDRSSAFKQIKDEYKALGQTVELFNKTREEGEEAFIERLKTQGKQVDIIRNAQTGEISKITTTYKNNAHEIQKDVFVPITRSFQNISKEGETTTGEIRGFVAEINKLKNTEKFNFTDELDKFERKLEEARYTATVSTATFKKFWKEAEGATSLATIEKLNRELEKEQETTRRNIRLDKEQVQLVAQRNQLMANLTRIQRMYLKTVDKDEAQRLKNSIEAIGRQDIFQAQGDDLYKLDLGSVREAREQISIVNNDIKQLNARATEASKASLGVVASLKTAMEKFPIWMLASTAFYGVIGTAREFGTIIIDIDKKMTDLKKVMSPDTDFGAIFDQATASAETFGKTISETMDAYNMFAKQGFKGDELQTLANAGLVAGNVGDIEAGKASEYLTASILQWDKDTSEAMSVVDSWNEISNNFATTVENLAQGQAKAGATARALGMDFDQLNAVVGTLNARTKQSGNEIGNFVKSTFSNILSSKAGNILDELGVSLENDDGSMRDLIDVYKDVAKVYVTLDQADKNRVTLGLAGKYHISRMQTFLDDLGKADSMYDQMYDKSQNSANSAMSENQTYMQSLEARINLARVEIEKLALAIGEAFMTEGMIQALQLFRIFAEAVSTAVKHVGFLAPALLGIVTTLALLSNRFSGLIGGLTSYIGNMKKAKTATKQLDLELDGLNKANVQGTTTIHANTTATNANAEAKNKASKASKLLSVGFGALGLASIAVGFGIEQLLGWIGKARQEQEEFENTMKEQSATYEQSREDILALAESYGELSKLDEVGQLDPNTEKYAEYVEVQNQLAQLLPDLKAGEDGLGNSILKSNSYVEAKVGILERQLEAQLRLNEAEAEANREENFEKAQDSVKESKKTIDRSNADAGNGWVYKLKFVDQNYSENLDFKKDGKKVSLQEYLGIKDWGDDLESVEQLMKSIEVFQKLLADKEKYKLSEGQIFELESALPDLQKNLADAQKAEMQISQANEIIRESYVDMVKDSVDSMEMLSDEAKEAFSEVAYSTLSVAEGEEQFIAITDAFKNMASDSGVNKDQVVNAFEVLKQATSDMKNSGITDVKELEKNYKKVFEELRDNILSLSGLEEGTPEYKALKDTLNRLTVDMYKYEAQVLETAKAENVSAEEARQLLESKGDLEEGVSDLSDELAEQVKSLKELSSFYEQLTGVSEEQIEKTDELIFMYQTLSEKTNRTTEENELLEETIKMLTELYPDLVKEGEVRIANIQTENEMVKALQGAYVASKDGILNAEEKLTIGQAEEVLARMRNLRQEAIMIDEIQKAYEEASKISAQHFNDLYNMGAVDASKTGFWLPTSKTQTAEEAISKARVTNLERMDSIMKEVNTTTNSLNKTVKTATEREKDRTKAQDKSTDSQSELQKITDKYAVTLDKLNTQLAQVHAKQKKYPTYSKEYRNALQEEINLLNQQINLNNQKAKDLDGVPATTTSSGSTGGSTTSSSSFSGKLSGWNHPITSGYGAKESFRTSPHTGVDIDGYMGESLASNVNGKVIKVGSNSISGNFVKIRDEQGYEHFYGHLSKITASLNQVVKIGTEIGKIGNTGRVFSSTGDGSHLHYEVKLNGKQVDPTKFAKNAQGNLSINVNTGSSTTKASTGNSTKDTIWNYFKGKGLGDNAVAGIMGNIQQESNFNPKSVNKSSGASGIFQWLGSRKTELMAYAKNLGKSWTDLQVQLDFAWKELNSTEKKSLTSLQKNMSATDHASEFERLFERSGGSAVAKRKTYATNILKTYGGSGATASTGTVANNGSDSEQIKRDNIALAEQAQELYYGIIKSKQAEFQRNFERESESQQRRETIKQGLDSTSKEYEDATNMQYASEQRKYKYLKEEYDYIQKRIEAGSLTMLQEAELYDRRYALVELMEESQNAEKAYYSEVVEIYLTRYDEQMQKHIDTLDWESTKIQEVDKSSTRYAKTLEKMANAQSSQLDIAKKEQAYIDKQLKSGKVSTEMYETLQERAKELSKELVLLQQELQKTNYEMIMTNLSLSDEDIDDIDFNLDRSKSYESFYDDGSADQRREITYQLDELKKKYDEVEQRGKNLQLDMRGKVLGHNELQELEELLEDNALALLDVQGEILETQKRLEEFDKIIDDEIADVRGDAIDKILDTLKDSYKELADIEEKRLDDLIDAENERHDKAMKNLSDELDQFNKIIDAQRRKIDDADRDRTHNNNITELTTQKQDLQSKLNLLSNVNTYEGKKEREELQKQIDEIDKQIVEERYQYEKDLRHQQLDDELEEKTEHIEELQELEDEKHKDTIEKLDKEKEYYQKYYEDLLNDEREFERLRKEMLAGNFTEIEALFKTHAEKLKKSLPDLELTLKGMTERVGTQIRENVIYELENMVKEIEEVEKKVAELNKKKDEATGKHGGSGVDKPDNNLNDENGKMKEADLKVILAKFMNEQIAGKLNPETNGARIKNIKDKADKLALEGRDEGSTIGADLNLNDVFSSLSDDQIKQVGSYFQSNASESEFETQEYLDYIENFGKTATDGQLFTHGDKQVMMAKYMNEKLTKMTDDKTLQKSLKDTATTIAETGRKNGSLIPANTNYDSQMEKLTQPQRFELGEYILKNSSLVTNGELRSKMEDYAENLKLSYTDEYTSMKTGASLDTGGMTKAFGSSGGVDGKGGKMAILHEREIVLNPVDTARILNVASIMENIMRNISGVVNLPTFNRPSNQNPTSNNEVTNININVEKLNGTQSDIDNLAKQIQNRLLREKGKR